MRYLRNLQLLTLGLLLALACSAPSFAEDEKPKKNPLISDRPSLGNASFTVGKNVTVIEAGFEIDTFKGAPNVNYTPILVRHGLSDNFEISIGSDGLLFSDGQSGVGDLEPGFKWNFIQGDPSWGLLGSVVVPSGSRAFRSNSVVPSLTLSEDHDMGNDFSFSFDLGGSLAKDDTTGNGFLAGFTAIGVSKQFTDKWSSYVEVAAFGPDSQNGPIFTAADIGVLYLVNDDFQLDVAVFRGLSTGGLDWGYTTGFTLRF